MSDPTSPGDGLPVAPKRLVTSEQPRVYLDGQEATAFIATQNEMKQDTRSILTMLRERVMPQLERLQVDAKQTDIRIDQHASIAHNRMDGLDKRIGRHSLAVLLPLCGVTIAVGGSVAVVIGRYLQHVLGMN